MAAVTTTPVRKLRFGQIVEYRGSITPLHGEWYRISGSDGPADAPRYRLAPYWGTECGESLKRVRHSSITPIQVQSYTCRECHLQHAAKKGDPKYPCALMQIPDAVL